MTWSLREFLRATRSTEEEPHVVLAICNRNVSEAMELFSLYPRKLWSALPEPWAAALARLALDVRKKVLMNFLPYFPRVYFEQCRNGLKSREDPDFFSTIALRAFANSNTDGIQRDEFAQTLEMAQVVVLPLFREWVSELLEIETSTEKGLECKTARDCIEKLLNETLPSLVEANPVFCGIVEDFVNAKVFHCNSTRTALHYAAMLGDVNLLNNLLVCNARFDLQDNKQDSVLQCGVNHPSIVATLLDVAESVQQLEEFVQQSNFMKETALHFCHNVASARLLLRVAPDLVFAKSIHGNTALFFSVNKPSMVEYLLSTIGDALQLEQFVQHVNRRGQSVLHFCGNAESARLLLRVAPNLVFAKDKEGKSVLHATIECPDVIEMLFSVIEDKAQLEQLVRHRDCEGETALHWCKNAESARLLLRVAPDLLFAKNNSKKTTLHTNMNYPSVVEVLLAQAQDAQRLEQFLLEVDRLGSTALHCCGNAESARFLLQASMSLLFITDFQKRTTLHRCLYSSDMVKFLFNAAREVNSLESFVKQVNARGEAALHLCVTVECARLLYDVSPNLASMQCYRGNTPLHLHVAQTWEDMCRFLIEDCDVDVNVANAWGRTPLHVACYVCKVELVVMILARSPNQLVLDSEQRTVLHYALMQEGDAIVRSKDFDVSVIRAHNDAIPSIVRLFLTQEDKAIASQLVAVRDVRGRTALHYCMQHHNRNAIHLADMVMMAGADGAAQDARGDTAMHIEFNGYTEVLKIHLIKHWGLSIRVKNRDGRSALDIVRDAYKRRELQRVSVLAGIVTLRLAARPSAMQCPWKRFPQELFRELVSFLV